MFIKYLKRKIFRRKKIESKRINSPDDIDNFSIEEIKIINLLNYTKKSGATYSGELYNSGYHTLNLGGKILSGQRNPGERFKNIPYDFNGKSVLDIGSNQGGMLHSIADIISYGVGIDYDSKMINVSNRIKSFSSNNNLDFYTFDLEKENLNYIRDFIISETVDICFLLSVCMWLNNWRDLIKFCCSISKNLLFESNGSDSQQKEQIDFLYKVYKNVQLINETSDDDLRQKKRKLFLCKN